MRDPHRLHRVSPSAAPASWRNLPTAIWALGFGSLFMDASSELIHSLLPIFMVTTLGASMLTVGIIEGIAEATAAVPAKPSAGGGESST